MFRSMSLLTWNCFFFVVVLCGSHAVNAQSVLSRPGNSDNRLASPGSRYLGLDYGQWSAEHWKWLFSLPVDNHPLLDTADIGTGQRGPVWFIGGTLASSEVEPGVIVGEVEREGNVPVGKSLFFPMVSIEGSVLEGNGTDAQELREYANTFGDFIDPDSVYVIIDGKPVTRTWRLRADSPAFHFGPLPANNVFQLFGADIPEGTTSLAVSDGYWAMLKPLPVGIHTIEFGGVMDLSPLGGPVFIQDVRYTINVVPACR